MKSTMLMKSLCDEIAYANNFKADLISSLALAKDFIKGAPLISSCLHDFIKKGKSMADNKLADLSMDFSIDILEILDRVTGHSSLKNQLERSATSIGANIREAKYAHSKADFIAKLQIALKECYETEYWLELFEKANITNDDLKKIKHDCGAIRKMLIASINTAKAKN